MQTVFGLKVERNDKGQIVAGVRHLLQGHVINTYHV